MQENRLYQMLESSRALLKGHFRLSSGRHSDTYLQCALILQYPTYAAEIGDALADYFRDEGVTVVVGPALGGVTLAYETARALDVRGIFAERTTGDMQLRRGFSLQPGDRVLITEDVVTTGGSVKEVIALLQGLNATIVGVGSIIDRSAGQVDFGYPFKALLSLEVETYAPENCPLCQQGIPVIKPGSRA